MDVKLLGQDHVIFPGKKLDNTEWNDFKASMKKAHGINFFYLPGSIPNVFMKIEADTLSLRKILANNFGKFGIRIYHDPAGNYFLLKEKDLKTSVPDAFFKLPDYQKETIRNEKKLTSKGFLETKNEFVWQEIHIGQKSSLNGKEKVKLHGKLVNSVNKQPIFGANLYVEELKKGTTTDADGKYDLDLPPGGYTLRVSSLDSKELKYKLNIYEDGALNIELEPKLYLLNEVVVKSNRYQNVRGTQMGIEKLSVKNIKEIPVVLGEKDISKVALLLPGVQSMGEGSSGFNVRGSPADQNLFYIDQVPVYNTAHLFGFFSAFNSDAIDEFTLFKSNIPIEYGGRLASIFKLNAKKGRLNKFSARGGISPITTHLLAEGPLSKGKSSFLLAARSTYSDWLLKMVRDPDIRNSSAGFSDGILNLSFQLDKNNHLGIFAYGSKDRFRLSDIFDHDYYNLGSSVSWRHIFDNKHAVNLSYVYAQYGFSEKNQELDLAAFKQSFQLDHHQFNAQYSLKNTGDHDIKFGINTTYYMINRGDYIPAGPESSVNKTSFEPENAMETGIFAGDQWQISKKLTLEAGLRLNYYAYLGPHKVYNYLPGEPMIPENITDTIAYGSSKIIKSYNNIDYRFAANYTFNENLSLKASFNKLHQYIFLLSNSITISPTSIWKLSDPHIRPMHGDQFSLGIYKNIWGGQYELSVESYYKKAGDLVEYKDGAEFTLNKFPETDIIQGDLDAWGVEFMIKKSFGTINGWFNYTYSRAKIKALNTARKEENNFGLSYPANYDKPHALNLVLKWELSKRLSLSGNVVYATGRPITLPTAVYYQNGMEVLQYSLRNEFRLPDYFRADVSLAIEGNLKRNKLAHGSFVFSVYNITGRKNAYSVFFESDDGDIKAYKLSIFGAPIFSVSYNFKLGNYED